MEVEFVERTVLGAMLLEPVAVVDALAALHWTDFSLSSHQTMFAMMAEMGERGEAIDITTLIARMGGPKVDSVGGVAYLFELTERVPRNLAVGSYCRTIASRSLARRGVVACQNAQNRLMDITESPEDVLDALTKSLMESRPDDSLHVSDVMPEVLRSLDDPDAAISTGIADLDDMTGGGMRAKELWVIGAQPSGGKSSLARQVERAVMSRGIGVHAHSIEVPREDWVRFHVAHVANVPAWKLRQPGLMNLLEKEGMHNAARKVSAWPLTIDDAGSVHIRTLLAKSRLTALRRGVRVYTVDYLQMVKGDERDMRIRIGEICRGLKQFAKDHNVTVLLLSQMARRGDVNARPSLQDLKESGDIEATADVAILNYRPKQDDQYTGEDELIVAKQRNGPIGSIPMRYNPRTLTFDPRSA